MLIGRVREFDALKQALEGAKDGRGSCWMLAGEAGIGKSRLVDELKIHASSEDFQVVQGDCFQQDASFPYAPWIDALRMVLSPLSPAEILQTLGPLTAEINKLLPELQLLIPEVRPNSPLEPAAEKYRSFELLTRFLLSPDAPRTSLIILEDLHWSDSLSLDLFHFLARRISHLPVVLIGTYRSEERSQQLDDLLSELSRGRLAHEIAIKPFDRNEAEQLVRAVLGAGHRVSPAGVDALLASTDGNPLYLEEILKSLTEEGHIDDLFQRADPEALPVPGNIQRMVQLRVEQLPEASRRVLTHASVIGQRFDLGLLQETTGRSEEELLAALKLFMDAHLVVSESANQFAFWHAMTRQAVYSMLILHERKAMHQGIGEALERLAGAHADTAAAQLAYHYYQAGIWEKAIKYSQRAGERAMALYARHEALSHFTHTVEAAKRLGIAPPRSALRGRAQAYEASGEFDLALADYEATLDRSRREADRPAEWQALIDLGLLWQSGDLERAGEYYREALELARLIEDSTFLAESLNRIGNWDMNSGRVPEALTAHREALELFRKSDNRRGMAQTLELLGLDTDLLGDFPQGTAYLEHAVPLLRELDERQGLLNALINIVLHARFETEVLGDTNCLQLVRLAEEALEIARASNWQEGEARALIVGAAAVGKAGEFSRALEWLARAESLTEERRSRESFTRLHATFGEVFKDLLAPTEAWQHYEIALASAQELDSRLLMLVATAGLVAVSLLEDDLAHAKDRLDSWLPAEYPEGPVITPTRRLWSARAELELAQGNPRRALEILDRLLGSTVNLAHYGPQAVPHLSRLRARALAAVGRLEEAAGELHGTLPLANRQGNQSMLWRLHADLGRVQRALGRRDDAEREYSSARAIIGDLARALPQGTLRENFLQRALETMPAAHVPTPRQTAKSEFGGLTAREREVAVLVAQGKSNRAVADELVISETTAERHVANILRKLGFNSRTQIALWTVEKGLRQ